MHNLVHAITHLIFMRVLKMRERKKEKETTAEQRDQYIAHHGMRFK